MNWTRSTPEPESSAGLVAHLPVRSLGKAIAMVEAMTDERRRAHLLAIMAPRLTPALVAVAISIARKLQDEQAAADAWSGLAPYLPTASLPAILSSVAAMKEDFARATALRGLAVVMADRFLPRILREARRLEDPYKRRAPVGPILAIAERAPPRLFDAVLSAVRRMKEDVVADLIGHLAALATARSVAQTRGLARVVWDRAVRAKALGVLAGRAPRATRAGIVREAMSVLTGPWEHWDGADFAAAAAALAPHLSRAQRDDLLRRALGLVQHADRVADQARAMAELGPHLSPSLIASALSDLGARRPDETAESVLVALAPYVPIRFHRAALAAADRLPELALRDSPRIQALASLAPRLDARLRRRVLARALALVKRFPERIALPGSPRARALVDLAPHLSRAAIEEALAIAAAIDDGAARAEAIAGLAPHLRPRLLAGALTAARSIREGPCRAMALTALVPYLRRVPARRRGAGSRTAGEVPPAPAVLSEAIGAAQVIDDAVARAFALGGLVHHAPSRCHTALLAATSLDDTEERVEALVALLAAAEAEARPEVATKVLLALDALPNDRQRAQHLVTIVPDLGAEWVDDAVALARSLSEEDNMRESPRATALVDLLGRVWQREDVARDALRSIERSISPEQKARLLPAARHLPRERKIEAFQAADAIEDGRGPAQGPGEPRRLSAGGPRASRLRRRAGHARARGAAARYRRPRRCAPRGPGDGVDRAAPSFAGCGACADDRRGHRGGAVCARGRRMALRAPGRTCSLASRSRRPGAAKARVLESALAAARKLSPEGPSGWRRAPPRSPCHLRAV